MATTQATVVTRTPIKQEVTDVDLDSNANSQTQASIGMTAQIANMQGLQAMFLSNGLVSANQNAVGGGQATPLLVFPQTFSGQAYMPLYDASKGQISPLLIGGVGSVTTAPAGGGGETSPGSSTTSEGGDSGVLDLSKGSERMSTPEEKQTDEQVTALNLSKNDSGVEMVESGEGGDQQIYEKNSEQCKLSRNAHHNHTVNQHGRPYHNGRPLSPSIRADIIRHHVAGVRPCEVSRRLKVSHGVVSKIIKQFRKTGSINPGQIGGSKPKVTTPDVVARVRKYKQDNPQMFAWEIKDKLLTDEICTQKNIPSISSINRIIRDRAIRRENYETDSSDGGEAITPAQIKSLERMGVYPDVILKENSDVAAAQEMLKELARLTEITKQEVEIPEDVLQRAMVVDCSPPTIKTQSPDTPDLQEVESRSNQGCNSSSSSSNDNNSGNVTVLSPESYEEMVKNMMQKAISVGYCTGSNQSKPVPNQSKPVPARSAVPIVIEPGRNEGRTMKAIADTVVDNVMLSSKQKDVSSDEGRLTRKRKGTPLKLAPTQTRGLDCEEEYDVLFTESEINALSNIRSQKSSSNIGKLKVPLIPPERDSCLVPADTIVTLAKIAEPRETVAEDVVELSDDDTESDTEEVKGQQKLGQSMEKDAGKAGDETLAQVQILLLNGQEYEIVPLGSGRWVSKNEYELQKALTSVKRDGQAGSGNNGGKNCVNSQGRKAYEDVSTISTQDNHVSSSKLTVSPQRVILLTPGGKKVTTKQQTEDDMDEDMIPSSKRIKQLDKSQVEADGLENCRSSVEKNISVEKDVAKSADLSDIMETNAEDSEEHMVINEDTIQVIQSPESCDRKLQDQPRKKDVPLEKDCREIDSNILENLLK